MPQIGAVIVPINYRLTADDFAYLITHSGSKVVCAHPDLIAAVDRVRDQLPASTHFVALEGARDGWLDYEQLVAGAVAELRIARRSTSAICWRSTTPAARRRGRRA